jgi:hypothetical protein
MINLFFNLAIYQIVWFLGILGDMGGTLIALPLLCLHLVLSPSRKADLKMMAILLFAGLMIDGVLYHTGFFGFDLEARPIPFWLAVIWLALATLPHHSLAWLKTRPILSALFGAIGGPLAYWAGVRLGAASFTWPLAPSLLVLAIIWGLLWPGIMTFAAIDRVAEETDRPPYREHGLP